MARLDLTGKTYGYLTVKEFSKVKTSPCGSKNSMWICECKCGNDVEVLAQSLKSGNTLSCGCYKISIHTKHGMVNTGTYKSWSGMKSRCFHKSTPLYKNYGGRGITVCDRWLDFNNFLLDMGERPKGKSLDRIDVNKNYEPSNCRWATVFEQANNTTRNHNITFNGVCKTLTQWANQLNISTAALTKRLNKWSLEKALTTHKKELTI